MELHNEQHELIRTLDVNEYDLNMRDLSTDIASELSTEDIEEEEEVIHRIQTRSLTKDSLKILSPS